MKIWEILKDENIDKGYRFDYILKIDESYLYRVEHEMLSDISNFVPTTEDQAITESIRSLQKNKWMNFSDIMLAISWLFCSDTIKDIMTNGTWYIKRD